MSEVSIVDQGFTEALNPPQKHLPTMYDLPSEGPEESGLPDDFHYYQPQLLRETFQPDYPADKFYVAADLNLYYDPNRPLYHKRPDWFAVLGADRFYEKRDLRLSYVMWQELVAPYIIVELLSPSTEKDDRGQLQSVAGEPPSKGEVYEQILRVPYYVLYNRQDDVFEVFVLVNGHYQAQVLGEKGMWFEEAKLGLAIWTGEFCGLDRTWLRWYGADGEWIATQEEDRQVKAVQILEQERLIAEQEQKLSENAQKIEQQQRAEQLAAKLRELGIDPDV